MSRVLCSYSGVDFKCEHFLLYNTKRESHHPIFDLPTKELLAMQDQYDSGKFSYTENYLYYLALFRTTGLVSFRYPAVQTGQTQSIIANTMPALLRMVYRIHTISYTSNSTISSVLDLPSFVLSEETNKLDNTKYWLEVWERNYADYQQGYKNTSLIRDIAHYEEQIEKRIKSHAEPSAYGHLLAEWASRAGAFPTDIVWNENDKDEPANEYWKRIIRIAAKGDSIFHIPVEDLNEVIEQCEDNIFQGDGAIQGHILMRLLRDAREKKVSFGALGAVDIRDAFKILDADASTEDANLLSIINSAPINPPVESAYPNKLAFRIAKMKYNQAQEYYAKHPQEHPQYIAPQNNEGEIE